MDKVHDNRYSRQSGHFFTVLKHKEVAEHGVWAESRSELIKYLNKKRRPFIDIIRQVA